MKKNYEEVYERSRALQKNPFPPWNPNTFRNSFRYPTTGILKKRSRSANIILYVCNGFRKDPVVNNRVKYDPGYLEKVPPHLKHKMSISKKTFVTEK